MSTQLRNNKKRKHFLLDQKLLDRAKEILGTKTETETVEVALERVICEAEAKLKAHSARNRFERVIAVEKVEILDVFGSLKN